jgi:trans-aconitate methyltransferase
MPIETSSITLSDGSIRLRKVDRPSESFEDRIKREYDELAKALAYYRTSEQTLADYTRTLQTAASEEDKALNFAYSTPDQIERACATHKHAKLAYQAQDMATAKASSALDSAFEAFYRDFMEFHLRELDRVRDLLRPAIRSAAQWPDVVNSYAQQCLNAVVDASEPIKAIADLTPPVLSNRHYFPNFYRPGARVAAKLAAALMTQYNALIDLRANI